MYVRNGDNFNPIMLLALHLSDNCLLNWQENKFVKGFLSMTKTYLVYSLRVKPMLKRSDRPRF